MKVNSERLKLEVRRARTPFLIYVCLVVAGFGALYGILRNQTFLRPWEDHVQVRAAVVDAKGLVAGKQEVRIAGIKVGVVTKTELRGGRPIITLQLDRHRAPVYRDARLRLRPVTPLQDMYVDLDRGTPSAGELRDDDVIPEAHTVSPVDVSRVLNTFDAETRDRLSVLLHEMGPALRDNGAQLRAAFVQAAPFLKATERVTQAMADRRRELARVVTNFGRLTDTLASHDGQLAALVHNGNTTLGELARRDAPLAETLGELPRMLTALDGAMTRLGGARAQLDPALVALRPAAAQLEPGLTALGRLGRDALPAFTALRAPVDALRPMARTLRPTAAGLADALAALDRQAPAFDRITKQLLPCREMVRQFFSNTPSVGKFSNAISAYPRGDVSFDAGSIGARSANGLTRSASCTDREK
jgi:virulence factor Mce-like protein